MFFEISYAILLVITLVFGGINLFGPVVVLYIVTCFMAVLCKYEKVSFPRHNTILLYSIFISIYSISCVLHNYLTYWLSSLIGFYFVSYIWIWATYILIVKYKSIKALLYTLLLIGFINAIVTIGQHFMHPIALAIPELLQKKGFESMDVLINRMGNGDYEFALWGIFDMVSNGYYTCVTTVLSVYVFIKTSKLLKYISFTIWLISAIALFYVQERAALVCGISFSLMFYLYSFFKTKFSFEKLCIIIAAPIAVVWLFDTINIESLIEGTRYVSFEMGGRSMIYQRSFDYFMSHPFTANLYDFYFKTGQYPHNLFYNAFIYGTIIGGVIVLSVLLYIGIKAIKIIIKSNVNVNMELVAISFAFLSYNAICLTHNASIVSGDVLFWLLATPITFISIPNK